MKGRPKKEGSKLVTFKLNEQLLEKLFNICIKQMGFLFSKTKSIENAIDFYIKNHETGEKK